MHWTHAEAAQEPQPVPELLTQEMRSAHVVQTRLMPRSLPAMSSLEYAGCSLPGHAVGGDFYDFLSAEPGRLTLIQGDISGKGVPAALMMAALQSSLRSHYAVSRIPLGKRIDTVNRLFFECTAIEHYASLFVGEYDDATGRLRYANCGHVPPLIVRADLSFTRLRPTATVLGMFLEWTGKVAEIRLNPGDTLVLATDGILEATDAYGREFGEARLIAVIRRYRDRPLADLTQKIVEAVQIFSGHRPAIDDQTLVVGRVLSPTPGAS